MSRPRPTDDRSPLLDRIIIGLVVAGVTTSLVLEVFGLVLFCHSHGTLVVSSESAVFIHGQDLRSLVQHMATMAARQGIDVFLMTLGIIVLILTPFARVAVSILYFVFKRDILFFCITSLVFVILVVSLLVH